jgi:hypothetical protein
MLSTMYWKVSLLTQKYTRHSSSGASSTSQRNVPVFTRGCIYGIRREPPAREAGYGRWRGKQSKGGDKHGERKRYGYGLQ